MSLLILVCCVVLTSNAAEIKKTTPHGQVVVSYEIRNDNEIYVTKFYNGTTVPVIVNVDGALVYINAVNSANINKVCKRSVFCEMNSTQCKDSQNFGRITVLEASKILPSPVTTQQPKDTVAIADERNTQPSAIVDSPKPNGTVVATPGNAGRTAAQTNAGHPKSLEQLMADIDRDAIWGEDASNEMLRIARNHIDGLAASANKVDYIEKSDVVDFIATSKCRIDTMDQNLSTYTISQVVNLCSNNRSISPQLQGTIQQNITDKLQDRINSCRNAINELEDMVNQAQQSTGKSLVIDKKDLVNYAIIAAIILLVILLIVVIAKRPKRSRGNKPTTDNRSLAISSDSGNNTDIVIRRKTTSILKKQCIDDVIDNAEYMVINTADFCPDSAVRNIYIKNTCVKEIYDIYAEDLRNADRPNEDGCMVLGRWVWDEAARCYDVTLETTVLPGDDAVFKEYELNFGGKIKLRVVDKLRKLRRDTNLQYDLTCWVHSHPGLGVFFSNSDTSVQMQLKSAQHPYFLTAFVVDILTDKQELGIFTFRKDGTINSRKDLTKMYSLEDMYKWSVESRKHAFSADNYYNLMQEAAVKHASCIGVELNNNAIIDLSQLAMESIETGLIGCAVGYQTNTPTGTEYIISSIYKYGTEPNSGVVGCLLSLPYMSLPTIQRTISTHKLSVNFVMVYSTREQTLTTIPVINGEIVTDEKYYAEEKLENLKIWTRRRR